MDDKTKILDIIRMRGPSSPTQISKALQIDSIMASAMLSELVSEKTVKISSLKMGSSPLYYLRGQEAKLEQFVNHLNEKDRRTVALLKQKKILKDSEQEPLIRVSLRSIRDFALPLQVSHGGKTELFWKWQSLPPEETETLIKGQLGIKPGKPEKKPAAETKPVKTKPETHKALKPDLPKAEPQKPESKEGFAAKVHSYFSQNNIKVLQQEMLRKTDYEYVVKVPSAVGELTYYCRAKDKKRVNEGDLAAAYVKAGNKKLHVLFLTTGEVTKKAKAMIEKEFKNLTVKGI